MKDSGVDAARLANMFNTANRSALSSLRASFQAMGRMAVDAQRELSRSLLPAVQQQMKSTYVETMMVERGAGVFMRMKGAMRTNSQKAVHGMFDDAMFKLLDGISKVIKNLETMISATVVIISKTMENVFSICWDDQSDKASLMDPAMQQKIRECRDALLPDLNKLCEIQKGVCELLGIEREEMELNVMSVENFEHTLERRLEEAKKSGDAFDLCDSDAEVPIQPKPKVQAENNQKGKRNRSNNVVMQSAMEVIDLLDSDDDWAPPSPSGLDGSKRGFSAVKSEML